METLKSQRDAELVNLFALIQKQVRILKQTKTKEERAQLLDKFEERSKVHLQTVIALNQRIEEPLNVMQAPEISMDNWDTLINEL